MWLLVHLLSHEDQCALSVLQKHFDSTSWSLSVTMIEPTPAPFTAPSSQDPVTDLDSHLLLLQVPNCLAETDE